MNNIKRSYQASFLKSWLLLIGFYCIMINISSAQVVLKGNILDEASKESLVYAHCIELNTGQTVVSDNKGSFTLNLPNGEVVLQVNYLGYQKQTLYFYLEKDTSITVLLKEKKEAIEEVNVIGRVPIHEQTLMGKNIITIDQIENGILSFGISDLMKAVTAIPGVGNGREGQSNFYVRGGDRGQNLILLDGAKLYNTNHLGGFVSLFNSDVIKQVDLYKGGYPARFGGRASSVLDIITRDGDRSKQNIKFSIGLLTSNVLIDGPLGKKVSFVFGARTSYFDLFSLPLRRNIQIYSKASFFTFRFYDVNAKLTYFINMRNNLFLNFFEGKDRYIYKERASKRYDETIYKLGNRSVSLGHNFSIGNQAFLKNRINFSSYRNSLATKSTEGFGTNKDILSNESKSDIKEINVQSFLEIYAGGKHSLKTGVSMSHYLFNPGIVTNYQSISGGSVSVDTTKGYVFDLNASEVNVFIEDEFKISNGLSLNMGLRQVLFHSSEKNYFRTEPRLSFRAMINNHLSYKCSYTIMNQFNHVAISNYGVFEKEIWLASTKEIPPQNAQQVSAGLFASFLNNKLSLSTELYYKEMNNLLEYNIPIDVDFVLSDIDDLVITNGEGKSYGLELQGIYNAEGIDINAAYVLGWNYRKFQEINHGEWYPFIYDRRHDFSLSIIKNLNNQWRLSSNFIFSTGIPFTLPVGYIKSDEYMYEYYAYSKVNNKRLPNYHRLDVSFVKNGVTKNGKKKTWKFNVFNIYGRQNPVIIYYDRKTGNVYKKSLFSIIPTVSLTIDF